MGTRPGTTKAAVVAALQKQGNLTANEIAERTGIAVHSIRVCIGALITRWGGVVKTGKRGYEILYGVPGRDDVKKAPKRSERVAGPRYVGDITVPLRRDPFEHMRLALAVR